MKQRTIIHFQAPDYWYNRGLNILKLFPGAQVSDGGSGDLTVDVTETGPGELTIVVRRGTKTWEETADASQDSFSKALFRALSDCNGQPLSPWGILTGVRPGKLAATLLAAAGPGPAMTELEQRYLVDRQKAELVLETVANGRPLLAGKGLSIYVSVPFCPSRCHYCSFAAYPRAAWEHLLKQYLATASGELDQVLKFCRQHQVPVNSIYVGGGTPTVLEGSELEQLLQPAAQADCEFTVEAGRPDTVSREKLAVLSGLGVNRISINCQFPDDTTLAAIGRTHTVADFDAALDMALASGIPVVNSDFVVGLPGQHLQGFCRALDDLAERGVQNITIHSLAVKRGAQISSQYLDSQQAAAIASSGYKTLREAGYRPYYLYRQTDIAANQENVGFGLPGTFCYYNIASILESEPVIGVGAGAVSKLVGDDGIATLNNPRDPGVYLQRNQQLVDRKLAWLSRRFC